MTDSPAKDRSGGTRHLVAPDLVPMLDMLPTFDFTPEVLAFVRAGAGRSEGLSAPPLSDAQRAVNCEQRFVPGPEGAPDVRVLVYTPPDREKTPRPALLHIHGGGFVLGIPEMNDASNRALAAEFGCIVVSVDYRLAPETRFPGALEDSYAALAWLHGEAHALGVDRSRIAVAGESAGAGHAAALAIHARDRGAFPICLQVLDSPMLDDRTGSTHDPHPYCGEFVWTPKNNRFGWQALLGAEPGGPDVPANAVPARVEKLAGLPPAFISVGALDLFLEETLEYVRRLIRAGVPAELHVVPGAFHGFGVAGGDAPQVQSTLKLRRDALARAFAQSP